MDSMWDNGTYEGRHDGGLGLSLATLVVGAVVGAAAALLLAPKTGQDLRTRVGSAAGDWKAQAADALARGRERVVDAVEQTRTEALQPPSVVPKGVPSNPSRWLDAYL